MSHKKTIDFINGLADPGKRVALSNDELIRIDVEMVDATPAKIKTLQGYKKLYEEIISSAQEENLENEKTPPLTSNDAAGEADPETAADPGNVIPENHIAVTIVSNREFYNMAFPVDRLGEFAEKLRREGPVPVQTNEREFMADGLIVQAKGSKNSFMLIPGEGADQ